MAFAYSIKDQGAVHYVTFTVHQWEDVFTRPAYVDELLDCKFRRAGLQIPKYRKVPEQQCGGTVWIEEG